MKFDIVLNNMIVGFLVILFAYFLVFIFDIQKNLTPEEYFSLSEFFVVGIESKNILIRILLIISYNLIVFLVINNFYKTEIVCTVCMLSTLLGSILIVYPAYRNKDTLPNYSMRKYLNIIYAGFVFVSFVISITTMIVLVILFDDINLEKVWKEQKTAIILYFLSLPLSLFINPVKFEKKMKITINDYNESHSNNRQEDD
ncbi:hypothetical protein SSCHL_0092 [Staphylococcus schleiferi]|uniref:hypothetical protein n=1 Tax=Staphylococcus coagulans TaxID=74706 RepID=UPI0006BCA8E7|nr:hypothetical protein [Staphylococcus coagulans]BAS44872.1 hypothetical protein SSCHL_0092 [Staphylococcus schleiferi]MBA8764295.1 hypothetical protein [Staphylococcus coagulans]MBT2809755.1 hypothetical protein [Staphylococcus coagulans]MBT2811897.1 hypothetical protein [Staphylococcus coagulans]MBT2818993.1 hypothetical protein [Staphylococcus coagulans]